MKSVDYYIRPLLRKHSCVILPGFGAFVLQKTSARLDEAGNLLPPGHTLRFNRLLNLDDGLLTAAISREEELDFEEAREKLAESIRKMIADSRSGKTIFFNDIGSLSANSEGWSFAPALPVFYHDTDFGLQKVTYSAKQANVLKGVSANRRKKFLMWQRATLLLVAAVLLGGLIRYTSIPGTNEHSASIELPPIELPASEDAAKPLVQSNAALHAAPEVVRAEDIHAPENNEAHYFSVIVGSFKEKGNAARVAATYGKSAIVLPGENNLFRVAIFRSTDSLQADRQLHALRKKNDNGAWLLAE